MEKDYLFLSLLIPQELEKTVRENSTNYMTDASNALEHNLMNGFAANLQMPPKVINVLPIGSYPQYYRKPFLKRALFQLCGRSDHESVGFCNIKFIRNFLIERSVYRALRAYYRRKNGQNVLIVYSASDSLLGAVEKLKKKYSELIVCDIIADLPGMTNLSNKKSALLRYIIKKKAKKSLKRLACVDCFTLLTRQMADYLDIKKPFCVMEGIASDCQPQKEKQEEKQEENQQKTILYTGTLHQKFGIMNLVSAFNQIKNPEYRLVICGIGDCEAEISAESKQNPRICFLGQMSRKEVLDLQRNATVLVNPRQNNEAFTKYSFPSKTMEYLSSGIPVVAYKLDGIPDEYDSYIQYVTDNSIESLREKLIEVCELPDEKRKALGAAGKAFVLREKNCKVQTGKIVELIESLAND